MTAFDSRNELAGLRQRVYELEETLRAIQEGEVDGVLVQGQVYLLQGAESSYRVFLEQMGDGAAVIDRDATILYCNRRFAELLGTTAELLTGAGVSSLSIAAVRDCLADFCASGEDGSCDGCKFIDASGRTHLLRVTVTSIQDTGNLAVLLTDLTDAYEKAAALEQARSEELRVRERTEALAEMVAELRAARAAALNMMEDAVEAARSQETAFRALEAQVVARRASEEATRRLAAVVEQSSDSIVITDAAGTIEYVNPSFERTTGYSAAEAIGGNPRVLKSGQHDAGFYRELWSRITSGEVWRGHLINRRKDGVVFHEDGTIFPVRDGEGKTTSYVAIKRDITNELALREQLVRSQRMEAIGTLAGGVAHDFNNLMQAMSTFIALLRRERHSAHLEQLAAIVQRGSKLTRQLLLFARSEILHKFEPADLNEIVTALRDFLRRVVRENIVLTVETAPRPLTILADRGQLEQVIMNLVLNAIDAMPDGGVLSISTRGEAEVALLEVADSGTGIPLEIRDRVFDPFFTTKSQGKGTGLGLSVVEGIVTSHEGAIGVECPDGGGTRFAIRLPRYGQKVEPAPVAETGMPEGRGQRVLVVEDEPAAREGLCAILELIGYQPVAFDCGEDAIAPGCEGPFDVLLTDITLPGITGIEVARVLGAKWPGLRIIMMSGYAPPEIVQERPGRTSRILQKPFEMDVLARALHDALAE